MRAESKTGQLNRISPRFPRSRRVRDASTSVPRDYLHTVLAQRGDAGLLTEPVAVRGTQQRSNSSTRSSTKASVPRRRTAWTGTSATARTASMASAAASAGLAMASGAEGRSPRPLAPKFGIGSGLVRRLLGRFRPGAQSRSQNRTRAPVGRFDGQPRGGFFEALAVDAINEVVLSWRGPRRTKLLDLVHGKTMPCFPHRVDGHNFKRHVGLLRHNSSRTSVAVSRAAVRP